MIISHQWSYLFVEVPHTASTAISHELCKYYAGEPILYKHSTYQEFLSIANTEEKNYLAFAGVRNPMDIVITRYFKRKTDHQGFFTNPKYLRENGGHVLNKKAVSLNLSLKMISIQSCILKNYRKTSLDC